MFALFKRKGAQLPRPNFILTAIVPTVIALIYLGAIASDRYTSESQFFIKRSNSSGALSFAIPFIGSEISTSQEDALLIEEYLHSQDLLERLDSELSLIAHYQNPEYDFWSRLEEDASREDQLKFFRDNVAVTIDPDSSILTLKTTAFSPEMAYKLNQHMLRLAEQFTNDISDTLAEAQIKFIQGEVELAEAKLSKVRGKSLAFQQKYNLIDPENEGTSLFERISGLEAELSRKQTQLKTLQSYLQESSPRVATAKKEVSALAEQIQEETRRLVGNEQSSLNQIITQYQQLKIDQEFAVGAYTAALASLESSRTEAARQAQFLVTISSSRLPESTSHPELLKGVATVFALCGLLHLLSGLIVATINDHQI